MAHVKKPPIVHCTPVHADEITPCTAHLCMQTKPHQSTAVLTKPHQSTAVLEYMSHVKHHDMKQHDSSMWNWLQPKTHRSTPVLCEAHHCLQTKTHASHTSAVRSSPTLCTLHNEQPNVKATHPTTYKFMDVTGLLMYPVHTCACHQFTNLTSSNMLMSPIYECHQFKHVTNLQCQ